MPTFDSHPQTAGTGLVRQDTRLQQGLLSLGRCNFEALDK